MAKRQRARVPWVLTPRTCQGEEEGGSRRRFIASDGGGDEGTKQKKKRGSTGVQVVLLEAGTQ